MLVEIFIGSIPNFILTSMINKGIKKIIEIPTKIKMKFLLEICSSIFVSIELLFDSVIFIF